MPMSISDDMGKTWKYVASELPPIDGGQRLVLMRLNEGPLLLVSFTDHPQRTPLEERGLEFKDKNGNVVKETVKEYKEQVSTDPAVIWHVCGSFLR